MNVLRMFKIVAVLCIVYNAWLLVTTNHIQKRYMTYMSLLSYNSDLYHPLLAWISPTLNLISGWILFFIFILQISSLVMILTPSFIPCIMAITGLVAEGIVYIAMEENGKLPTGAWNPGWTLVLGGLGLLALTQKEQDIIA